MEVLLDSNFIISCIKKRIDFFETLEGQGFKVTVPKEVIEELKDLRLKVAHADRTAIDVALELFSHKKIRKVKLPKGPVDAGLIAFGKKGAYIATLDAAIKRAIPNAVTIDSRKNGLIVERS